MLESFCLAKRPTIGRDSASGVTEDPFKLLFKDYPCSVQHTSTNVGILYAQRNTVVTTTVYFAQDPNLEVNDLLIITDRTKRAMNYLVRGESSPVGRGRLWGVDVELIRSP